MLQWEMFGSFVNFSFCLFISVFFKNRIPSLLITKKLENFDHKKHFQDIFV